MGQGKSKKEAKVSAAKPEREGALSAPAATIIAAVIGLIGVLITSYFAYMGIQTQIYGPLHITETALAQSNAVQPTDRSAAITASETPLSTATTVPMIAIAQPSQDEFSIVPVLNIVYQDIPRPGANHYDAKLSRNKSYLWTYLWCAKFENNLNENLDLMEFSFFVDGVEIDVSNFLVMRSTSTNGWPCQRWTTRLSGWEQVDAPGLSVVYKISNLIFDGVSTYEPGEYRHEINLIYVD